MFLPAIPKRCRPKTTEVSFLFTLAWVALLIGTCTGEPCTEQTRYGIVACRSDDTVQCLTQYGVCIGNEFSSRNSNHLRDVGIGAVVSAIGAHAPHIDGIEYLEFRIVDGNVDMVPLWEDAHRFISAQLEAHPDRLVLVHCAAGVSRSSAIIIYHLMMRHGLTYDRAFAELSAVRPVVRPNTRFESDLRKLQLANRIDPHEEL